MSLQNLKNQKGFTIVELLIVIVVIGILAAIVIVAYNGVTSRANTTNAQGNATAVKKAAEVFQADPGQDGQYPTATEVDGYNGITKVPDSVTISATAPTSGTGKTHVSYTNNTTGACVGYWDFTAGAVRYLASGTATLNSTASTCTL